MNNISFCFALSKEKQAGLNGSVIEGDALNTDRFYRIDPIEVTA